MRQSGCHVSKVVGPLVNALAKPSMWITVSSEVG